jgi:hypothetical protein
MAGRHCVLRCHLFDESGKRYRLLRGPKLVGLDRKPHVGGQSSIATTTFAHMNLESPSLLPSPTLIFTVTLSCRLVLNLKGTDARVGARVYSGSRTPDGDTARSRVLPRDVVEISAVSKNVVPMKSTWMEDVHPSFDKSSSRGSR